MGDTQWPRFYVFKQDTQDAAHVNCGTVHAPDPEFALMNARDVFVRRPECYSLWVVPAARVYALTTDELAERADTGAADPEPGAEPQTYHVFQKPAKSGAHTWIGTVEAAAPAEAFRLAMGHFTAKDVGVWLVVPETAVVRNPPEEGTAWFSEAQDKPYRHQSFYHTQTLMLEVKRGRREQPPDEVLAHE